MMIKRISVALQHGHRTVARVWQRPTTATASRQRPGPPAAKKAAQAGGPGPTNITLRD